MANTKKSAPSNTSIAQNKKAFHDYFITERFEAGIVLEGWEVKSIREGRAQLKESYVIIKNGEAWILGMHITPLTSASTHIHADPVRTRKLLLNQSEINKLIGSVERKGFTLVPISLYWKKNHVKLEIGLAEGKKQHDKRDTEKQRDWERQKARLIRSSTRLT